MQLHNLEAWAWAFQEPSRVLLVDFTTQDIDAVFDPIHRDLAQVLTWDSFSLLSARICRSSPDSLQWILGICHKYYHPKSNYGGVTLSCHLFRALYLSCLRVTNCANLVSQFGTQIIAFSGISVIHCSVYLTSNLRPSQGIHLTLWLTTTRSRKFCACSPLAWYWQLNQRSFLYIWATALLRKTKSDCELKKDWSHLIIYNTFKWFGNNRGQRGLHS